ncbi:glutaminase, partial [Bradyrhizobium sp. CSS354]|uniref:glutaminase n=1 Tax=Bradyrhizobium sp. CSS354 TaxID=2699172 RepID=UPI0023B1C3CA
AYCRQCAIEMTCEELARAVTFLACGGRDSRTGEQILPAAHAKRVNALMLTCGTYDAAGDFAFRIGLPVKSGVGGGIVAVMPNRCGVCVWSPALDRAGNSQAGARALELLTTHTGWTIF